MPLKLEQHSDEELAIKFQQGHQEAFRMLSVRYRKELHKQCKRCYLSGGLEMQDLTQEAWIGLYHAARTFDIDKNDNFHAYARMIIHGHVVNALRLAARRKYEILNQSASLNASPAADSTGTEYIDLLKHPCPSPEEIFFEYCEHMDRRETIRKFVHCLTPLEQKVLLSAIKELSYKEMAAETGMAWKSIDNALQRIKKKMSRFAMSKPNRTA